MRSICRNEKILKFVLKKLNCEPIVTKSTTTGISKSPLFEIDPSSDNDDEKITLLMYL